MTASLAWSWDSNVSGESPFGSSSLLPLSSSAADAAATGKGGGARMRFQEGRGPTAEEAEDGDFTGEALGDRAPFEER